MRASIIALFLLVLLLAGCGSSGTGSSGTGSSGTGSSGTGASASPGAESTGTASELRTVTIDSSGGGKVELMVEIADDPPEQTRGLMERTALGEDRGMLFVYPDEQVRSFWMKNTLIPLSIAYIASDGSIVDLQDMKPLDDDPPHYVSAEPARYALEVNEGYFEKHGIKVGDRADLPV
jgi:uncharacterized membrane protein (UPF0127 family)